LRLKEGLGAEISPADTGNFIHELLKDYHNTDFDVDKSIEKFFKKYNKFNLKANAPYKAMLIKEAKLIVETLKKADKISKFTTKFVEKGSNFTFDINGKEYHFYGIADRVDVFEDYFRVIDYKTGSKKLGGFNELFYGEKLQLYLYARAFERYLGLKLAGVYYFMANKKSMKLNGFSLEDNKILEAVDTSLSFENPKSEFYSLKLKTDKKKNIEKNLREFSGAILNEETFKNMCDYAEGITKIAIKELENGNMDKHPIFENNAGACKFCGFGAICKFNPSMPKREQCYKIDKDFFGGEDGI